ncbi:IclR family transcriptional regulator [Nocardioides albidus]|uniref:IclR family transcriptional regulator n=1 Tax=Nocardioides albidus TaxID=1517589 RepID=A0A5C4VTE2_9ACTN|nr:IclR family transcriptional regulator [Nocardioides albidus]TNM38519.1 IclR family transcriptional regulator [Nocardioides albidus]
MTSAEESGPSVLERSFRILGAFDPSAKTLTLTALSQRAGVPKSSTLRLVRQLVELGALERTERGDYAIGLRMLEMAALAPRGHGLRATALPYMEDLHRVTRQHVLLAVREGTDAVLVERLSARDAGRVLHRVGGRLPLTTTGVGRVLLAHAPADVLDSLIGAPAPSWRAPDIQTPDELRVALAEIRHQGFAEVTSDRPEPEPVTSMAAAIRRGQEVIAALSVVAPTHTLQPRECRAAVMTVARAISRELTAGRESLPR